MSNEIYLINKTGRTRRSRFLPGFPVVRIAGWEGPFDPPATESDRKGLAMEIAQGMYEISYGKPPELSSPQTIELATPATITPEAVTQAVEIENPPNTISEQTCQTVVIESAAVVVEPCVEFVAEAAEIPQEEPVVDAEAVPAKKKSSRKGRRKAKKTED